MFILKKIFVELLSCATAKVIIFLATTWPGCCYCCCASFAKFVYYSRLLESWAAEHHTMLFIFNALCVDSLELSRETCLLSTYLLLHIYLLTSIWMITIFWINCPRHQAYCMNSVLIILPLQDRNLSDSWANVGRFVYLSKYPYLLAVGCWQNAIKLIIILARLHIYFYLYYYSYILYIYFFLIATYFFKFSPCTQHWISTRRCKVDVNVAEQKWPSTIYIYIATIYCSICFFIIFYFF